jgi:hypothetical protein
VLRLLLIELRARADPERSESGKSTPQQAQGVEQEPQCVVEGFERMLHEQQKSRKSAQDDAEDGNRDGDPSRAGIAVSLSADVHADSRQCSDSQSHPTDLNSAEVTDGRPNGSTDSAADQASQNPTDNDSSLELRNILFSPFSARFSLGLGQLV